MQQLGRAHLRKRGLVKRFCRLHLCFCRLFRRPTDKPPHAVNTLFPSRNRDTPVVDMLIILGEGLIHNGQKQV